MKFNQISILLVYIFTLCFIQSNNKARPIDANTIPKYVTQIKNLPIAIALFSNHYQMVASKKNVTILPDSMKLKTLMYVFSSLGVGGVEVDSPKILVQKNQQTTITWVNNIQGYPILPIDTTISKMIPKQLYETQVPMIPHLHGLTTISGYDGRPNGWFTRSGVHGPDYFSNSSVLKNTATFVYQNKNLPGMHYFHDHTISITRLNVICGLKGVYQIETQNETKQQQMIKEAFGDMQNVQLLIADIKLQQNGSIYYHDKALIPEYTYWIPQYFGDIMTVNGKSWPFFNVQKKTYRLKIMSTCNSRYLNIFFQDSQFNRISFNIVKMDSGYLNEPVQKDQILLISFGRVQLIIDFSDAIGDVIMRNDAKIPYPDGEEVDQNLDGQIMKFKIKESLVIEVDKTISTYLKHYQMGFSYPKYQNSIILPFTLYQIVNQEDNPLKMLFNAENMYNGKMCQNRVFKRGQTYDLYIFNPTADAHPIHIHLVTIQIVGRYMIKQDFLQRFEQINGQIQVEGLQQCAQFPKIQDYLEGDMIFPVGQQKSQRDIIDAPPGKVTIIRLSMNHENNEILEQKYKGVYPLHCHMLQHEDNDLMCFFYLVNQRKCFKQSPLSGLNLKQNFDITTVREVVECESLNSEEFMIMGLVDGVFKNVTQLPCSSLISVGVILVILFCILVYGIRLYTKYCKRKNMLQSRTSPVNLVQENQNDQTMNKVNANIQENSQVDQKGTKNFTQKNIDNKLLQTEK